MQKQSFRRATLADVGAIVETACAAYAKWVPVIGREPKPMTANYHQAVTGHVIDLLEENGRLVALKCRGAAGSAWRGMGGLLLGRAEEIARPPGLNETRVYTNAEFSSNIAFYARRGYREFLRQPLAPGGEVVHMKKTIGR